MTELRTDPLNGRQVLVVPGRSARPNEHAAQPPAASSASECPFCEGSEARTPPEVAVSGPPGRPPNTPGWFVRTIPNRFPTVTAESVSVGGATPVADFVAAPAFGYHEVVIESPAHAPLLPFLPPAQVLRVLEMCRARVKALSQRTSISAVTLFENTGPESGGSLWHPHAQLVAAGAVPPGLRDEMVGAEAYRERAGTECSFESVRDEELRAGSRTVLRTRSFDTFAPYSSAFPYEMRVVPTRHVASFGEATEEELGGLSEILPQLLRALLTVVPGASYNLLVNSPAERLAGQERYHWHLDIAPRLIRPDGFDLGSGFHVNTVPPEDAARTLKAAMGAKP